ncbi:MAG: EamA family transporter [Betaproteobacteria bacterium]|nr:EamA family transporter [Betaproteobacteria bacterium]
MRPATAYALLSFCVLFWAGNVITARALHDEVPPFTLSFWRWSAALLCLLPWVARDLIAGAAGIRSGWRRLVPAGILGMAAYSSLVYLGLQWTSATNAALINTALPIVIAAIGGLLYRQRLALLQWSGVAVSLAGVVVIVLQTGGGPTAVNPGDLWVLAAVVGFAIYTVCFGRARSGLTPGCYLAATIAIAAAASLPLHLWEIATRPVTFTRSIVAAVAYLAIFTSILSYAFWNKGVETVGAARAGAFLNLLPVFTTGLAVALLDERLNAFHAVGALLILSGIGMTAWRKRR